MSRSGDSPAPEGARAGLAWCPSCYAPMSIQAEACPTCQASLGAWWEKSYAERLILALQHPLADVRMRAIITLGLRRERAAEPALVECAWRHPADVTEGLEIVNSLRRIREGGSDTAALRRLLEHPARGVRRAAREALGEGREGVDDSSASGPS
jgi:HEAT repeat protein